MAKRRGRVYVITFDDGSTIKMHGTSRADCEHCLQKPSSAESIEPEGEMESEDSV